MTDTISPKAKEAMQWAVANKANVLACDHRDFIVTLGEEVLRLASELESQDKDAICLHLLKNKAEARIAKALEIAKNWEAGMEGRSLALESIIAALEGTNV